jgi:hypothetical protein
VVFAKDFLDNPAIQEGGGYSRENKKCKGDGPYRENKKRKANPDRILRFGEGAPTKIPQTSQIPGKPGFTPQPFGKGGQKNSSEYIFFYPV